MTCNVHTRVIASNVLYSSEKSFWKNNFVRRYFTNLTALKRKRFLSTADNIYCANIYAFAAKA